MPAARASPKLVFVHNLMTPPPSWVPLIATRTVQVPPGFPETLSDVFSVATAPGLEEYAGCTDSRQIVVLTSCRGSPARPYKAHIVSDPRDPYLLYYRQNPEKTQSRAGRRPIP